MYIYVFIYISFYFWETFFSSEYNEFLFFSIRFSCWPSCIQKRPRPHESEQIHIRPDFAAPSIESVLLIRACTSYWLF